MHPDVIVRATHLDSIVSAMHLHTIVRARGIFLPGYLTFLSNAKVSGNSSDHCIPTTEDYGMDRRVGQCIPLSVGESMLQSSHVDL
jgi:hypothetical protein